MTEPPSEGNSLPSQKIVRLPGGSWWLLAVVIAWLVSRIHQLWTRILDPDEFEHLHASFCIARGMVPYRDFFEHHGPLTYYLAAPLNAWMGPDPRLLLMHRGLSLLLVLGTVWGVWRTARVLSGQASAMIACGWFVTLPCFSEKSLEWRPDVPAMFLLVWAAYFFISSPKNRGRDTILAGVLLGLAGLCTQKIAFIAAGLVVGMVLVRSPKTRRGEVTRLFVTVLAVAALSLAYFQYKHALVDMIRCMVLYPLRWPHDPAGESTPLVSLWRMMARTQFAPGHYALLGCSIVFAIWKTAFGKDRSALPVTLAVIAHLAALPLVPAVYLQYYLLVSPLAAVLVGTLFTTPNPTDADRGRIGFMVFPAMLGIGLFTYGAWPTVAEFVAEFPKMPRIIYGRLDLACAIILAAGVMGLVLSRRLGFAIVWLALLLPGAARVVIPNFYWPTNYSQFDELRTVHSLVGPEDKVLDGFSGLGCLRPHAYYFWWINQHSLPLMEQERAMAGLRTVIANGKPVAIVLDRDLDRLRDYLGATITSRYQPHVRLRPDIYLLLRDDHPVFTELTK